MYDIITQLERYQAEFDERRMPLKLLQVSTFPFLENVITCQLDWSNLDPISKTICLLILKCFHSTVFTQIDEYYQDDKFMQWMFFVKKIYDYPIPHDCQVNPTSWNKVIEAESMIDWKIKKTCGQIVSKYNYITVRLLYNIRIKKRKSQKLNLPDLSQEFYSKYTPGFIDSSFNFIKLGLDGFVPPKPLSFCFKFLFYALQEKSIVNSLIHHLDYILFEICIPMLGANQKDSENWKEDPASFLYSQESRLDGHNILKYASKDLIDQILRLEDERGQAMIKKLLDFSTGCFQVQINPRTQQPLSPAFKECLISAFIHCFKHFDNSDDNILNQAEQIIENYMLPELSSEHELIRVRMCSLLNIYGAAYISRDDKVMELCRGLEVCMGSKELVVQINALVALNKAVSNSKICELFSQHTKHVLELSIKCMNSVDYKELVYATEGIIKDFDSKVIPFSPELLQHFHRCFYKYLENARNESNSISEDDEEEEDSDLEANTVYESIYAAEACLDAILTIMQLDIPVDLRDQTNNMVLVVIADIIIDANNELLIKALSLLNFILYKQATLNDAMIFFFPVLCYILNPKPRGQLSQNAQSLPENFLKVLTECNLANLNENVTTSSLGCFLNFTSKMGPHFFTATDYYGVSFIDLLFDMIVATIKNALTAPSDTDIVFMLRIIIGMLEQSKGKYEIQKVDLFLDMVINLCEWKRTDSLSLHILQTVSMFIWYSPSAVLGFLKNSNRLESFYLTLFSKLDSFSEENAKERVLYGLVGIFEIPANEAKVEM